MEISYRRAELTAGAVIYGFPLTPKEMYHCGDTISPIPPGLTEEEHNHAKNIQINDVFHYAMKLCRVLLPGKVDIHCGYTRGKHYTVLTLLAATRYNDKLLPDAETLQKLKDIMAREGFKGEPRWFILS